MRLAPAFLLLMVVGWLRAFGATGGDDLQTTDFSRRWLRDSINPRTGRLILEITNETIVTNMPMTGTGFLHITDDIPDPEARAVDLSTDDVEGDLDILHFDGGLNANVNTFWRGDGTWSVVPANGVTPAGTGFTHNTGGTQDPDARAVDLSTPDVVGNLDVSHLDGGVGASAMTYWRGDKKWAPITGASGGTVTSVDVVVPGFMTVSGGPITTAGIITIGLSGSKLPITSVGAPSGNGFGHVTSGIWDPAAKAVDLSTADVTGNLPVSHLSGGINAGDHAFWRGDGQWTSTLSSGGIFMATSGPDSNPGMSISMGHDGTEAYITSAYFPGNSYKPLVLRNGGADRMKVQPDGIVNVLNLLDTQNGYTIKGSAASGIYLRGNGTAFVASALLASDLTGTIPIGSVAAPTGTGFGHITGGAWDAASRAVDLSSADVTGNLPVSNLNSGVRANPSTFWRGDGTWTDTLSAFSDIGLRFDSTATSINPRNWKIVLGRPFGVSYGELAFMVSTNQGGNPTLNGVPALVFDYTGKFASMAGQLDTAGGYTIGGAGAAGKYLRGNGTAFVSSALLASDLSGTIPVGSVGAPTGTGFGHITGGAWDAVAKAVDLSGADATGVLAPARFPALTGDVTTSAGSLATALIPSGVTAGSYGDGTHVGKVIVDGKGRVTSASSVAIAFPAGYTPPTGTGFPHITGGTQDPASRAVDLSGADVTGNLPVSRLNSGIGADTGTLWRGDGTWTNTLGATDLLVTFTGTNSSNLKLDAGNNGDVGILFSRSGVNAWHNFMINPSTSLSWYNNGGFKMTLNTSGVLDTTSGYTVGTAAAAGKYLRGNGTAFVPSSLLASDLSGTIPVGSVGAPTGTGFGHITGGAWDAVAKAVDLSGSDVTGNLPVSNLNGGTRANPSTFWRGDATWTDTLSAFSDIGLRIDTTSTDVNARNWKLVLARPFGTSYGELALMVSTNQGGSPTLNGIPALVFDYTGKIVTGIWNGTPIGLSYQAAPTGNGFSHVTGGVWDAVAKAVDLTADVTGNLPVSRLNGGTGAAAGTFWRGDGTWNPIPIPSGTGFTHITGGIQDGIAKAVDLSGADATGILAAARFPALTGDVTTSSGSLATTLANTAVTPGSYGDATHVSKVTVDAKGRVTSASSVLITASGGYTPPTGTGFPHITGGAQDPASRAVDISSADVTGNLPVTKLNSGTGATPDSFWRGDGLWTDTLSAGTDIGLRLDTTVVNANARNWKLVLARPFGASYGELALMVSTNQGGSPTAGTPALLFDYTGKFASMAGQLDTVGGYTIGGVAAVGKYLRGNGTAFVSSSLLASDLSGNIPPSILNGGLGASPSTFWRGDGVWTNVLSGVDTTLRLNSTSSSFLVLDTTSATGNVGIQYARNGGAAWLNFQPGTSTSLFWTPGGIAAMSLATSGLLDTYAGYTIQGAAATGKYLRGNGTAFISSSLLASDLSGALPATNMPAYTGDVTSPAGSTVNTLANTAVTPGTYGSATTVPVVTVDSKGRVTAATTATLTAPPNTGVFPIRTVTGVNTTITDSDYTIIGNASQGVTITFTLPLASTHAGRVYIVKYGVASGGGGQVAIAPQTGDFIDGTGTQGLASLQSLTFQSDGGHQWYTIGERFFSAYPMTARTNNIAAPRSRSAARGRTVTR